MQLFFALVVAGTLLFLWGRIIGWVVLKPIVARSEMRQRERDECERMIRRWLASQRNQR